MEFLLFLDTADRDKKVVRLLEDSKIVDEVISSEDEFISINKILKNNKLTLKDISRIDVNKGPGSFTGLKIGVSIANAFNFAKGNIKDWKDLILPEYGREPNISKPKVKK